MAKSNTPTPSQRLDRSAHLRWIQLCEMKVSPFAQREKLDMARAERYAREFDPDMFDAPKVSLRGGTPWIIDGWHRTEAAKLALGDDQYVQCWVREGLAESDEAAWCLGLNDYRAWTAYDRYRMAVNAGHPDESDVDRIVRSLSLVVTRDGVPGAVRCVAALMKVYRRSGPKTLQRSLRTCRDAYGDAGYDGPVVEGIALFVQRYGDSVPDAELAAALGSAHGGVKGLLNSAHKLREQFGGSVAFCAAGAAVEIVNRGRGRGKKLPGWWKS